MLSPEDFAILLLCSPTVKRLKLTQCTTPFLDALVITSDRHLCPLLQSLHLTNSTFDGSYLVALARLRATSRHHPGVPGASDDAGLRLITLWKCDRIGAEGEDNIRKLSITLDYVDFNLVR
ncbi:hypothetical protein BOTBODRAFT_39698 [Botryobasidium botryosum FD-172 SS1]|uniref:F-box domain-containing protein n=1 Tax=Botryobasidium botryosum (strain FD-172 SS1) TaxID=930990 RepID=A0A067M3Z3_BOTB1|nr:hypothetical protein BOTBODRAFT_39698 [Botryobasidium botryosum FD-172 SS1]